MECSISIEYKQLEVDDVNSSLSPVCFYFGSKKEKRIFFYLKGNQLEPLGCL